MYDGVGEILRLSAYISHLRYTQRKGDRLPF